MLLYPSIIRCFLQPCHNIAFVILCFIFVWMKMLFFLLGCFILYLSCLPCSDGVECSSGKATMIAMAGNHEQHQHETENCTPFCNCSCCAASVYFTPLEKTAFNKIIFHLEKYPVYHLTSITALAESIWQPPRNA